MKLNNGIGWCDVTGNAAIGCAKVAPECRNCYAQHSPPARVLRSRGKETWGHNVPRHPVTGFYRKIASLNKRGVCGECNEVASASNIGRRCPTCLTGTIRRIRLFADSNSDWLDHEWPIETLARFLESVIDARNVDVQLLTKRLEQLGPRVGAAAHVAKNQAYARAMLSISEGKFPSNVWVGISAGTRESWERWAPELAKVEAGVRWISCEPLLESFNPVPGDYFTKIDWVVVGGESGDGFRAVHQRAIEIVAEHCTRAGVPVWVKQDAGPLPGHQGRIDPAYWALKQVPRIASSPEIDPDKVTKQEVLPW